MLMDGRFEQWEKTTLQNHIEGGEGESPKENILNDIKQMLKGRR